MKTPLSVLLLPVLALSLAAAAPAQTTVATTVALVDAPDALVSSSSLAEPSVAAAEPAAFMPVERAPLSPVQVKPGLHLYDWSMIGAASVLRGLDWASTESAMARPQYFHEDVLPTALVRNKAAFAGFQAGTVALNYSAYKLLVRHNMRSLARVSQYMYVGVMGFQVAHNYQALGSIPATPVSK